MISKYSRITRWYNIKEKSAGVKRLRLTWQIYKHFGEFPVRVIAFWVCFFTFISNSDIRKTSNIYFKYLYEYTKDKSLKPNLLNSFKQSLSYANSLVDKMIAYIGEFKNIKFADDKYKNIVLDLISKKQGAFFITNHIGSVEMMRAFLKFANVPNVKINVFLQQSQCEVFNEFINSLLIQDKFVELFPVEEINVDTSIKIKDKIENGEFVFMAGDRISMGSPNINYSAKLLNHKISLPLGVLKFALLMDCKIFNILCAKENQGYKVFLENIEYSGNSKEKLEKLKEKYCEYLEYSTLKYPYQFYNFFNIFES